MTIKNTLVNASTTARYTGLLVDETGASVPASILTMLTLSLIDAVTGAIVNNRDAQSVLNQNGVTVDENGNLVWELTPADTAILDHTHASEKRQAIFIATWASGAKQMTHPFLFTVLRVPTV